MTTKTWCAGYCGRMYNTVQLTMTEDGKMCPDCLEKSQCNG